MESLLNSLKKLAHEIKSFDILPNFLIGDQLNLWWDFGHGVEKVQVEVLRGDSLLGDPKFQVLSGPHKGEIHILNTDRRVSKGMHGYYEVLEEKDKIELVENLSAETIMEKLKDSPYYTLQASKESGEYNLIIHQANDLNGAYNNAMDFLMNERLSSASRISPHFTPPTFDQFADDIGYDGEVIFAASKFRVPDPEILIYVAVGELRLLRELKHLEQFGITAITGTAVKE